MGLIFGFLRLIASIFILIGMVAFGFFIALLTLRIDLAQEKLGSVWYQTDPFFFLFDSASLPLLQAIIERKIYAPLWNPAFLYVLDLKAWLGLLVFTVFFIAIGWFFLSIFAPKQKAKKR